MRIGIEAQRLFRPRKHGMDVVALEFIRALQSIDTSNDYVIFVRPGTDRSCLESAGNFRVREVPAVSYAHWEQTRLPRAVLDEGVELLHCTANTAPLHCPVPLVITLHDIIFLERKVGLTRGGTLYQRLGNVYRSLIVPRVVRSANRILTVSEYEGDRIRRQFDEPEVAVDVVPNAVGKRFAEIRSWDELASVRRKYNLPEEFLLFLGNTDPKKNSRAVVEAYCRYAAESDNPLCMVLADFDRPRLERLLRQLGSSHLGSLFVLPGYIYNEDMPAIYSAATAFLYPSLRESFGLPILEAMACGTPVMTSDTSAMPEVAGRAALLVDPTSLESMKNGIVRLARDARLRQQKRRAGLRRASEFSWERSAEATLHIYRSVLGERCQTLAA